MLVQFTVGNFLSFKDKKTLSMTSANITECEDSNVTDDHHKLLKGAVIYGANSSGKSNFINALVTLRTLIIISSKLSSTDELNITPYELNLSTIGKPSFFEIVMIIDGVRYRYGLEATAKGITAEWLFEAKKKKEKPLFIREGDGIEVMKSFPEGTNLEEKTRDNGLFLAVADQFNGVIAKRIFAWFKLFYPFSGLAAHENFRHISSYLLTSADYKDSLKRFFLDLDLGFSDIKVNKVNEDKKEEQYEIFTVHEVFDDNNELSHTVRFNLSDRESAGTNKLYNLGCLIFTVLKFGGLLVVDELDTSLHPNLTVVITRLFNSKQDNPHNAQLIFTTHDTNLLENGNYRRDQIYFVEKDHYGASDLYSLVEYKEPGGKTVRKDRSFKKDYIQGRYGAIPYIGNLSNLINNDQENKNS
jgi:AAA15 family ATPase/GTPase